MLQGNSDDDLIVNWEGGDDPDVGAEIGGEDPPSESPSYIEQEAQAFPGAPVGLVSGPVPVAPDIEGRAFVNVTGASIDPVGATGVAGFSVSISPNVSVGISVNGTVSSQGSSLGGIGFGVNVSFPVVLDLDLDGFELIGLSQSNIFVDTNAPGERSRIGWLAGDDAFLAFDENSNGIVDNFSEINLARFGAAGATDLQGLKAGFDSNNDNFFDSDDLQWSKFLLWRDLNGDGSCTNNEVKTLDSADLVYIDLSIVYTDQTVDGNRLLGTTNYRMGPQFGAVGDVALGLQVQDVTMIVTDQFPNIVLLSVGISNGQGDSANNLVWGNVFPNKLWGEGGSDTLVGEGGGNTLDGGPGTDLLYGGNAPDIATGGEGNDTIYGGAGFDTLYGSGGNDEIQGMESDDFLWGGDGNDSIYGQSGGNVILGENGNDLIVGGDEFELVEAGTGNDSIFGYDAGDTISGQDGNDFVDGMSGSDSLQGGDGGDSIVGNDGVDTLIGADGNDKVIGGNEADVIAGWQGNDLMDGELGNDYISGGDGNDFLRGGPGADDLFGDEGNDTIDGGKGVFSDTARGGNGNDNLWGMDGIDVLLGEHGNDTIVGGNGADWIEGGGW